MATQFIEKSVSIRRSVGGDCLACYDPIKSGEVIVVLVFRVPVMGVFATTMEKELHKGCAAQLCDVVKKRISDSNMAR